MRWDWLSSLKNRLATPGSRAATPGRRVSSAGFRQRIRRFESLECRTLLSATVADDSTIHDHDDHLVLDGRELHASPAVPQNGVVAPNDASPGAQAPFPLDQTFELHSRPGARHTVYLDFNGHVTSGTTWNTFFGSVVTPAYDFDGNVGSFSDLELERIQFIWERVVEDFSPFDINVTTEEPSDLGDLTRSGPGDQRWGVRVAIGGSANDWYTGGAGGVAFVGSFNDSVDTPTYVFPAQLANGNEKFVAEATSHEVGHTLGLSHDGDSGLSYYGGHGSGPTGWAPIMGVGYSRPLVQWSSGEYTDANNMEDDLAIITGQNGFGYRADLAGNSNGTAAPLNLDEVTVDDAGVIETQADVDVYSFTTGDGPVSFDIQPWHRSPNLDIEASLVDSNGSILQTSNPIGLLDAQINMVLPAGTYYLHIQGVGEGDPAGTGYTDYGSLGQFTITGNITSPATIDVELVAGDLILTDTFDKGSDLSVEVTQTDVIVTSQFVGLNALTGVNQVSTTEVSIPIDTVTGSIIFDLAGGDDNVTLISIGDLSADTFVMNGGMGDDSFTIDGGNVLTPISSVDYVRSGQLSGQVSFTSAAPTPQINYTGLERLVDTTVAANRQVTFTGVTTAIDADAGPDVSDGLLSVASASGTSVEFISPAVSLLISTTGATAGSSVNLSGFGSELRSELIVEGGFADQISVGPGSLNTGVHNLSLSAGTLSIDAPIGSGGSPADIFLEANSLALNGSVQSAGTLRIQPLTTGVSVGIGDSSTGLLNLDNAELDLLGSRFQQIEIGDPASTSNPVDILSGTFRAPVVISGSSIAVTGVSTGRLPIELIATAGPITSNSNGMDPLSHDIQSEDITLRTTSSVTGDIGAPDAPIYVSTDSLVTDSSASDGDQYVATLNMPATLTSAAGGSISVVDGTFLAGNPTAVTAEIGLGLGDAATAMFDLNGNSLTAGFLTGGSGGGLISLGSQTLTVDSANDGTFEGVLEGSGDLVKSGSGLQSLTGANTYSGSTLLMGGSLLVDGSIVSPVSLSGGFLGGSGTVTAVVSGSDSGGGIAPGTSPGQLTVSENVTLESSQSFVAELNGITPGTEHDQLVMTGTGSVLTLNNPTLSASISGYVPTPGDEITLIDLVDAGSSIVGTFADLPEGAAVEIDGHAFTISYSGGTDMNDVVLTAVPAGIRVVALQPSVTEDGGAPLTFQFQRFGDMSGSISINFEISGLADLSEFTVTGATAYNAMTGLGAVDLTAGVASVDVMVTPIADSDFELDEDVVVTVLPGTDYEPGATISDSASILNDDVGISLDLNLPAVTEPGTDSLVYTFTRHASTAGPLVVNFSLSGMNTAQLGTDYTLTGATTLSNNLGTVLFADGQSTLDLTVTPIDDDLFELPETVTITVESGTGYDPAEPVLASTQTGSIVSEDNAIPTLDPIANLTITEDDPQQTINLSGITSGFSDVQNLRIKAVSSRPDIIPDPTVIYTSPQVTGQLQFTPITDAWGPLTITVTVEDGGLDNDLATPADNLTFSRVVNVTVTPVNDDPTLDAIANENINEDSGEHTAPLTGLSPGPKEFEPFRITAVSDDTDLIPFISIDHDPQSPMGTLRYRTGSNLSGLATITVMVTDGGADGTLTTPDDNLTVMQTFDVMVNAVNDPPTLDPLSAVIIDEDTPMFDLDLTGISGGPDEIQSVDLSVRTLDINNNPDQSIIPDPTILNFSIDGLSDTATLRLFPVADSFGNAVIELTLRDFGPDSMLGTLDDAVRVERFAVSVRPVNDPPVAVDQMFALPESSPADTLVGSIVATDVDSDRLRYEILSGNTNDAFKIDTNNGNLLVNNQGALDLETMPSFDLTVAITDLANPPGSTEIQVTVNLNDLDPEGALVVDADEWLSNSLIVRRAGAMSEFIEVVDASGTPLVNSMSVPIRALASEVDQVIINGNDDIAESVLVDFRTGSAFGSGDTVPPLGLTFHAGAGDVEDSLEVRARLSDVFTAVSHTLTGPDTATIMANDNLITLNGVERIRDTLRAATRRIDLAGTDDQVTLKAGPSEGDFLAELESTGTVPAVTFGTPVSGMTIDLGAGSDAFTVESFEIGLRGRLTVLGNDGDDSFFIGGLNGDTVTLGGGAGNDSLFEVQGSRLIIRNEAIIDLEGGDVLNNVAVLSSIDMVSAAGTDGDDILDASGFSGTVELTGLDGDDVLIGGQGDDVIHGGNNRDQLIGGPGNDQLFGGLHADTLSGNQGVDLIDGQGGADRLLEMASGTMTLTTSQLDTNGEQDTLQGILSAFLFGEGGDDVIDASAFAGWVRLTGGAGNDVLTGGRFSDILDGEGGDDVLFGLSGGDFLFGGNGRDVIEGAAGDDEIRGGRDADEIDGGDGDDFIVGEHGHDRIFGGAGIDRIIGGGGRDTLTGNSGPDVLIGNGGFDEILETFTGAMEVTAVGLNGASTGSDSFRAIERVVLVGSDEADYVNATGFLAALAVFSGAGDDVIIGGQGDDVLHGGDGRDRLEGLAGDDVLAGQDGDDLLLGGAGDDFLVGGNGQDILDGGSGNDRLRGNGDEDALRGGAGNDLLEGNSQDDLLLGGEGDDTLKGGKGNDTLLGEAGIDDLDGERNRDTGTGGGNGAGASALDTRTSIEVIDDAFTVDFDALIAAF